MIIRLAPSLEFTDYDLLQLLENEISNRIFDIQQRKRSQNLTSYSKLDLTACGDKELISCEMKGA